MIVVDKKQKRNKFRIFIKWKILVNIITLFIINLNAIKSICETQDKTIFTKRFVEIEWDEIPYAIKYDLEIYNFQSKKFIKLFSSSTNLFKLNVRMGKYLIRSRFTDKFERISPWSELSELIIAPPPTEILSFPPADGTSIFANKTTGVAEINLNWKPLPQIEKYLVSVENPEGDIVKEFYTSKDNIAILLPPSTYAFKVKAVLADGTIGEPSPKSKYYTIVGAKILPPRIKYRKDKNGNSILSMNSELKNGVVSGIIEYQHFESDNWIMIEKIENQKIGDLKLDSKFKPGKYKSTFLSSAKGFSNSDTITYEFVIKPKQQDLDSIDEELKLLGKIKTHNEKFTKIE